MSPSREIDSTGKPKQQFTSNRECNAHFLCAEWQTGGCLGAPMLWRQLVANICSREMFFLQTKSRNRLMKVFRSNFREISQLGFEMFRFKLVTSSDHCWGQRQVCVGQCDIALPYSDAHSFGLEVRINIVPGNFNTGCLRNENKYFQFNFNYSIFG